MNYHIGDAFDILNFLSCLTQYIFIRWLCTFREEVH